MTSSYLPQRDYGFAIEAGHSATASEFRARSARYDAERDMIELVTTRGAGFVIPRAWIPALNDVASDQVARMEVWPGGSALVIEDEDIHISVHGLLTRVVAALLPDAARWALPECGGTKGSAAGRAASGDHDKKGTRPRKAHQEA